MKAIFRTFLVCILILTYKLHGQSTSDFKEKLSNYLSIQNKRLHFNGVVLIANEDGILFQEAIGFASHELQVPLTIDSKFKIASISKSFTGMLVAIAQKEGKLRLENTIDQYFPDKALPNNWNKITIRHLVSHTSGIPHWDDYGDYWTVKSLLSLNQEQILNDIFSMSLMFNPGGDVNYSSPAYFILATILEKVYNDAYNNILTNKILNPLGLKNTGVYNDIEIIKNMSSGYSLLPSDSLIIAPYRHTSTLKGAGSLYSNAKDLLTWSKSVLNEPASKDVFSKTTNLPMHHNNNAAYGMGWYIHNNSNRSKAYQVAGGTLGYSSISVIYPEEKLYFVLLSNVSTFPINEIWSDIEKIIFNKPFQLPEITKELNIPKEMMGNLVGTYMAENNMKLTVIPYQNQLFVKLGGSRPLEIVYGKGLVFHAKKINIKFTFKMSSDNKVEELIADGRGEVHHFKKISNNVE